MAKFFVGQKVRFIRAGSKYSAKFVGAETVIAAIGMRKGSFFRGCVNSVTTDCVLEIKIGGGWLLSDFDQIEPILDSHEPCESEFRESLDKLLSEVSCEAVE